MYDIVKEFAGRIVDLGKDFLTSNLLQIEENDKFARNVADSATDPAVSRVRGECPDAVATGPTHDARC